MQLQFAVQGPVPEEQSMHNILHAQSLGLPSYRDLRPGSERLAVVGGGPSLADHIDELKAWSGDIWAINGAWEFLRRHGIASIFYTVDAHPMMSKFVKGTGVDRALLCSVCDPGVFEALREANAKVWTFDVHEAAADRIINGTSTATTSPMVALRMGYRHVTYFGCEGSYFIGQSHTYQHEHRDDDFVVECGGELFRTAPDYYFQALELATIITLAPQTFAERSGGFLRAAIKNEGRHDVKKVSKAMAAKIKILPVTETEQPYHFIGGAFIQPGEEIRP